MFSLRRSLALKLSHGIMLMVVPIFLLAIGIAFLQSRYFIRQEAIHLANSVLNTTTQHVRTCMSTIETATNSNEWLVKEYFQPERLPYATQRILMLNRHAIGCSVSAEPDIFPRYGRYFSVHSFRTGDSIQTVSNTEADYLNSPRYTTPQDQDEACWVVPDVNNEGTLPTEKFVVSYCKPIEQDEGETIGVISTDIPISHLYEALDSADCPYPNAYFVLIDGEGHYLIHPDTARLYKKTIFSDADPRLQPDLIALGHEMTSGQQGTMMVTINDHSYHVCYSPIPSTDWSLALVCPDSDILYSYHKLIYLIVALVFFGLIITMILSYEVVTHGIRPIKVLLGKLRRIADGQYDTYIPRTDRIDAIGGLQNSFATMFQTLNFHMGSISYTAEQTQKRNEELTQAMQKAEEATRQKTLFIQNVTHQIRTPLNIIQGFAQILRDSMGQGGDDTGGLSESELASIGDTMKHNAYSLRRMVQMLFDSSETGISEELKSAKRETVCCNQTAREALGYTHGLHPNLHVTFETELPDDFSIQSNHLYLMRSLRELLYNAAKYSDCEHIVLRITQTDTTVRFIIEDTGAGISETYSEQVFKPFTKVNDLSEGLGLGLPLAKHHAIGLGGDLTLDASYHEGCRFIFELPKVQE